MNTTQGAPAFVLECDPFLERFPHRFDFLYAKHPDPGEKPSWLTEKRFELTDRMIEQGSFLYGVRFGKTTRYAMLDVDIGSPYHPQQDEIAFYRLRVALEPLGLVEPLICTSSDSRGLHLYFPFDEAQPSWKVGQAITALLENAGFKVAAGILEVFPQGRQFNPAGLSLYNGHRLPLQQGSYLLTKNLEPTFVGTEAFARQWQLAVSRNMLDAKALETVLRIAKRQQYQLSHSAGKFLNDLNAEIEPGWTGPGQTNDLLGKIATRSYIFGHILGASDPLEGKALVDDIVRIARALPGYEDFCGHTHEIEKRAQDWARTTEKSYYFHYKSKSLKSQGKSTEGPSWNEQQRDGARVRIQQAIAKFEQENRLPQGITARIKLLNQQGISTATLYQHPELWDPRIKQKDPKVEGELAACAEGAAANYTQPKNLLGAIGCNSLPGEDFKDFEHSGEQAVPTGGCKLSADEGFAELSLVPDYLIPPQSIATDSDDATAFAVPRELVAEVKQQVNQAIAQARAAQDTLAAQRRQTQREAMAAQKQNTARTKYHEWLKSGDPLLIAEAQQWFAALPENIPSKTR